MPKSKSNTDLFVGQINTAVWRYFYFISDIRTLFTPKMNIAHNRAVAIHYTLRNTDGIVLDSSEGKEPLHYLHGHGNLIPGMENGLTGKSAGDQLKIVVTPENGYGIRDEGLITVVPESAFGGHSPSIGDRFQAGHGDERYVIEVTAIGPEGITVDGNHPLAGVELHFDVEVITVREASEDEIAHGHVHGPGGHHH